MTKKDFLLAMGERSVNPVDTDELLKSKISERKRKEVERQEEVDEQQHKSKMAELKKKEKSAESAMAKTTDKREETGGIKVEGAVKLGTIDYQQILQQQIDDREDLRKQAEEAASRQAGISDDLRERLHASEIQVLKTSFDAQMQMLTKMIEANANKGGFTDELTRARAIAEELGYQKGAIGGTGSEMVQIELKKMDFDHQATMRKLNQEDKAEERRWQTELRRLDDQRDEARARLAQEEKKNDMFAKAPQMLGGVIAEGLMKKQGKQAAQAAPQAETVSKTKEKHIEAGWGDTGELECPECSQPIAIGPTAQVAACANCGKRIPIRRLGEKPVTRETPSSSQTSSQTTSQTSTHQAAKAPKEKENAYIETGWGESGEVDCPSCGQPIHINESALEAVCANCRQSIEVRRSEGEGA